MVDGEDEVVVITGGGSGLGECLAEIYGFRGVSVAVLDKRLGQWDREEGAVRGYRCDVGNREDAERAWQRIVEDVSCLFFFMAGRRMSQGLI